MSDTIKILYVDDDIENFNDLKDVLNGKTINGYEITIDSETYFEHAVEKSLEYNLIILDLFKGNAMSGGVDKGSAIYDSIRSSIFVPIIFYSANPASVAHLRSQVVGVTNKLDDIESLLSEIERLTKHNLPLLKGKVHAFIEDEFKKYFWGTIQPKNNIFKPEADDLSLGYMLLRNMADTLSRDNIRQLLGDDTIKEDKVHPMEFYIYPTDTTTEYQTGEIIKNKETDEIFVILTPSCDFIKRGTSERKVDHILLLKTILLTETKEYKKYNKDKDKYTESLKQFINSSKGDRYFFLPQTPFIENRVIDFQNKEIVSYEQLCANFERIAKLDNPYAQSMSATYTRYYNRIGFPDIDCDYILGLL
ncbi:MAG: response regulator [Paludibacteraceae bacterium]|nr:response regulator [Paludibacteraceae bacterium]